MDVSAKIFDRIVTNHLPDTNCTALLAWEPSYTLFMLISFDVLANHAVFQTGIWTNARNFLNLASPIIRNKELCRHAVGQHDWGDLVHVDLCLLKSCLTVLWISGISCATTVRLWEHCHRWVTKRIVVFWIVYSETIVANQWIVNWTSGFYFKTSLERAIFISLPQLKDFKSKSTGPFFHASPKHDYIYSP